MANIISRFFKTEIDRQLQSFNGSDNLYNHNTFRFLGRDAAISMPDNPETYVRDGYLKMAAVNRCVNLILTKMASVPIIIYEVKPDSGQKYKEFKTLNSSQEIISKAKAQIIRIKQLTEVSNNEINNLIEDPNEFQTWDEWVKYFVGSYLLTGNSYDYLNGPFLGEDYNAKKDKFTEMFVLPTGKINIISGGEFNPVKAYRMENQGSFTDYPASQIIHWKTFNPEYCTTGSQLYGVSPLRAYAEPLLRNKLGDKELSRQLNSGGQMGFISPKETVNQFTSDQRKSFKDSIDEAKNSNSSNARILPISMSVDFVPISLSSGDLELLKIKSLDEESIYKAYNIPLVFANQDASKYDANSWAATQFIYNAIAPLCEDIGTLLTKKICGSIEKRTGKNYQIYLDFNALPEMQADMAKVSEWISKSPELTYNEKREAKGYGRLDIEGMDSIFISGNDRLIQDAAISDSDFNNALNELNN